MQYCVLLVVAATLVFPDFRSMEDSGAPIAPSLMVMFLSHLLVVLYAAFASILTISDASRCLPTRWVDRNLSHRTIMHGFAWLGVSIGTLWLGNWGDIVSADAKLLLILRPLLLGPAICSLLASWAIFFYAERALDAHVTSLWSYMRQQIRQVLAVPLTILIAMTAWNDLFDVSMAAHIPELLRFLPLALLALGFPLVAIRLWDLKPLANDDLRRLIQVLAGERGVCAREVLVWNTGYRTANAAVMGMFRPLQYLLLTDRLVRDYRPDEIEWLLRHEFVHAQKRHALRIATAMTLAAITCSLCLAHAFSASSPEAAALVLVSLFPFFLVGTYGRLQEHEADLGVVKWKGDRESYLRVVEAITHKPTISSWLHPSLEARRGLLTRDWTAASAAVNRKLLVSEITLVVSCISAVLAFPIA